MAWDWQAITLTNDEWKEQQRDREWELVDDWIWDPTTFMGWDSVQRYVYYHAHIDSKLA